jgi:Fe(3+) dicitrate transport protein
LTAAIAAALPAGSYAQDTATPLLPRVDVVGKRDNLDRIPGSAYTLDKDTLETSRVFTINEALRKVPGVHVKDEEGFGLRPNIGIRGLNPTRSTKVTLLEDGLPLAYAPYGDNASYFHPPVERYERIEVLKGAGQVLYGPQTIGGVINYITPMPTEEFSGSLGLTLGNRDYANAHVRLSASGWLLDFTRKQGNGARDNTYSEINDVSVKKLLVIDDRQAITFRANAFTEDSQVTYSGITDAEYRNFGARYNPFRNDYFDTRRTAASATHQYNFSADTTLYTSVYAAYFSRDWWRQASSTTDGQCGLTAARGLGQAVNPDTCNSSQGRLRDYFTWGVEPRLRTKWSAFGVTSELDTGVRAHFEDQERRQVNAAAPAGRAGTTVENNLRETQAYSAFFQNRFLLGDVTVSPGLRFESIRNERTNRINGSTGSESLSQWIPSLGATWQVEKSTTLFAGVHRGFAPPRTEDIINTGPAVATFTNVGAELSTNWELGVRTNAVRHLNLQATAFRNDFSRLIAVGSIAGGGVNLSQGEALFQGFELGGRFGAPSGFYSTAALSLVPTAEQSTRFIELATNNAILGSAAGNRLPYAPKQTATIGVGYATQGGLDAQVEMVHVGEQFADFANVDNAATATGLNTQQRNSGQFGKIEAFTIFNAAVNYRLPQYKVTLFLAVKNLADKVYIVDRTRGILPGAPRLVQAGFRYDF